MKKRLWRRGPKVKWRFVAELHPSSSQKHIQPRLPPSVMQTWPTWKYSNHFFFSWKRSTIENNNSFSFFLFLEEEEEEEVEEAVKPPILPPDLESYEARAERVLEEQRERVSIAPELDYIDEEDEDVQPQVQIIFDHTCFDFE